MAEKQYESWSQFFEEKKQNFSRFLHKVADRLGKDCPDELLDWCSKLDMVTSGLFVSALRKTIAGREAKLEKYVDLKLEDLHLKDKITDYERSLFLRYLDLFLNADRADRDVGGTEKPSDRDTTKSA